MQRRYDIDWLRVITIGLLLIYHVAIVFQPFGGMIGFIQSSTILNDLWIPMAMLNVWRIPLLFFVSGMGVYFAMGKRSWKQLLGERTKRILIPYVFGILAIVPLHMLVWQSNYGLSMSYMPNPGHLWFLGNIFSYVLILSPLFYYLKQNPENKFNRLITKLFSNPLSILVVAIPFVLETMIVQPAIHELYAMTWHGFFLGLIAFFFGFTFVLAGEPFWKMIKTWKWAFLSIGIVLFGVRWLAFDLKTPGYLMSVESTFWIMSVLGIGHSYLKSGGKTLDYLSQAAYPIYIVHMVFLYLACVWILPLGWSGWVSFVLVLGITFAGCFAAFEVIRRISFFRPLFGLKGVKSSVAPDNLKYFAQ